MGSIVAISSIASKVVGAGGSSAAYEVSKAGLTQLIKGIAVEYASYGIRANVISPGTILTTLGDNELKLTKEVYNSKRKSYRNVLKPRPIERVGTAEEIAAAVSFLMGPSSEFTTGANIVIDGGYSLI